MARRRYCRTRPDRPGVVDVGVGGAGVTFGLGVGFDFGFGPTSMIFGSER